MTDALQRTIDEAWERRETLGAGDLQVRDAVEAAIRLLDAGEARVAEKGADGAWTVNQWLKKAVLLSFRLTPMATIAGGPGGAHWWDKVPSKLAGWGEDRFGAAGFRAVPARSSAGAPSSARMPS